MSPASLHQQEEHLHLPPWSRGLPSLHIFDSCSQRTHLFCWAPAVLFRKLMSPKVTELVPFSAVNLGSLSQSRVKQAPCNCMGVTIVLTIGSLASFKIFHINMNPFNLSPCCWQPCLLWLDPVTFLLLSQLLCLFYCFNSKCGGVWSRSSSKHPGVLGDRRAEKERTKLSGSEQWIFLNISRLQEERKKERSKLTLLLQQSADCS